MQKHGAGMGVMNPPMTGKTVPERSERDNSMPSEHLGKRKGKGNEPNIEVPKNNLFALFLEPESPVKKQKRVTKKGVPPSPTSPTVPTCI